MAKADLQSKSIAMLHLITQIFPTADEYDYLLAYLEECRELYEEASDDDSDFICKCEGFSHLISTIFNEQEQKELIANLLAHPYVEENQD